VLTRGLAPPARSAADPADPSERQRTISAGTSVGTQIRRPCNDGPSLPNGSTDVGNAPGSVPARGDAAGGSLVRRQGARRRLVPGEPSAGRWARSAAGDPGGLAYFALNVTVTGALAPETTTGFGAPELVKPVSEPIL